MSSLAQALPEEINRVRRLQDHYKSLRGEDFWFFEPAIALMETAITEGIVSMGSGDVVRMIKAFAVLQGIKE